MTWLGCYPVKHLPVPHVPSDVKVCLCPCGCSTEVWVARTQLIPVPSGSKELCQDCVWDPGCYDLRLAAT